MIAGGDGIKFGNSIPLLVNFQIRALTAATLKTPTAAVTPGHAQTAADDDDGAGFSGRHSTKAGSVESGDAEELRSATGLGDAQGQTNAKGVVCLNVRMGGSSKTS